MAYPVVQVPIAVPVNATLYWNMMQQQESFQRHAQAVSVATKLLAPNNSNIVVATPGLPVLLGRECNAPAWNDTALKKGGQQSLPSTSCSSSPKSNATRATYILKDTFEHSVKNTFVHVDDSSDDESCQELRRSASEPDVLFRQQGPSSFVPATKRSMERSVTEPVRRSPQESVGAAAHYAGDCRPCAWFWKTAGCDNGKDCRHCHLCGEDEIKKRRKTRRVAERKAQRILARSARAAQ